MSRHRSPLFALIATGVGLWLGLTAPSVSPVAAPAPAPTPAVSVIAGG